MSAPKVIAPEVQEWWTISRRYSFKEYVLTKLPEAYAYQSESGGGWCIDAVTSPVNKPVTHLTAGHRTELSAWKRVARMFGVRSMPA